VEERDRRLGSVVSVRPATARDRDRLLDWANDPVTRAAGFSLDRIDPEAHRQWFARRLAEPDQGRIWIGRLGRRTIGVIRVDRAPDHSLAVGIALDPAARGRGLSRPLLEAGLAAARVVFPGSTFRAWIRADNAASLSLFRAAGFVPAMSRALTKPTGASRDVVVLERG